jgi:hypothetical protein
MQPARLLPLCIALAGLGCASAPAGTAPPAPRVRLASADCLDPQFARGWHPIDDHHVLVDAGRRKYRITVSGSCLFGNDIALRFEGDAISGRVCGIGDRIVTRDGTCWVDRLELIDAATWNELQNEPRGSAEVRTNR